MVNEKGDRTALVERVARAPIPVRVRMLGAKATPSTYRLRRGECVVGAGGGSDVILDDTTVSRRHVKLTVVEDGVRLDDLGSRNGTFYLGQRVERITLALGSRVKVGAAELLLEVDDESLCATGETELTEYRGLFGTSPPMRRLFAVLGRLEGSLVNVLIEGESGVGKELLARALHEGSSRRQGPYVAVNCGALSRELVASELFGHKRGAFTGALESRRGAFERADGGTLFLDEIGELPLSVQPMLLRALESGEVQPLGEEQTKRVKVRVIAATNRSLSAELRAGRFREDLYFRLAVITLTIPPLRERPEDVGLLAARFAAAEGVPALPEDVLQELGSRSWQGNVRELRNAVLAYLALGELSASVPPAHRGDQLERALGAAVDLDKPYAEQKDAIAARFTRVYLEQLLKRTGGNQSEAARLAGLDRGYLGKLVARHGLARGS